MTDTAMTKTETQDVTPRPETFATPAVDAYENDDELLLLADLPGVKKDGVSLRFEDDRLLMEARHADGHHVFRRTFSLEERFDAEGIVAKLEEGVLSVHLPKSAHAKPREIPIS